MKRIHIPALALVMLLALTASCKKNDAKETPATPAAVTNKGGIAFVNLDTLEAHYQYFIDTKAALEAKSSRYEKELMGLSNDLERSAADFQQKLQNGSFTSEQQARSAQNALVSKQNNLQNKQAKYAEELQNEQDKFNKALHDSLTNYINAYNKTHKYTMILSKVGDNILYADPATDITAEVLAGLNNRYKKK